MAIGPATSANHAGNRGHDILGAILSTYCISILAIGLRTAARRISKAGFWIDDWLIFAGTVLYTAALAVFIETVHLGAGRHIQTVNPGVFERIEILFFSTEIVFPWAIGLVKCSVLAFYWRIFHVVSIRRPILIVGAVVVAWAIAFTLATTFQCVPAQKLWEMKNPGHCVSKYKYFLGSAIPEVLTDFIILAMPLPYVWNLQMKLRQKLLLSIVFILGGFAAVSSILRLWAFVTRNYSSPDLTYTTANPAIWSCVEASIAVTSACLPSLRPIFAAMGSTYSRLRSKRSTHSRSSSWKESSETSDRAKLHHALVDMHSMTERFNSLDLPTEQDTSHTRHDDRWKTRPEAPQIWGSPAAVNVWKGAEQV